ncbi:acetylxylan esterase [Microlunatus sp. GCM10028923]|uniref:glucuronyl esterase domain-containing protein n=1 Tax=Microlunatus sp. GCM10028923 TaxID=3273400 RepID=UPI00361FE206
MNVREHFADRVYGRPPAGATVRPSWSVLEEGAAPEGATRRQLRLHLTAPNGDQVRLTLLVHLPTGARPDAAVPAFCGMNFRGNHACTDDPAVIDPTTDPEAGDPLRRADEASPPDRGEQSHRWPFGLVAERGWASVTWCYLQLGPDDPELFETGPHLLFSNHRLTERDPGEWGAIGIWAWTMSRVLDALTAGMVPEIDATRVIAHGHSRLGKTAIWAGVEDQRFAAVISNDSGCLGAALTREVGETPAALAERFPHWVAPDFATVLPRWRAVFDGADPDLPDQPDLLALIAPRPLYVASASEDAWADPEAEFLAWQRASAAWPGGAAATAGAFPGPGDRRAPDVPLGYHLREGGHDVFPFEWQAWLDFADRWVR